MENLTDVVKITQFNVRCDSLVGSRWEWTSYLRFQQPRHHSRAAEWNRYSGFHFLDKLFCSVYFAHYLITLFSVLVPNNDVCSVIGRNHIAW